MIELERQKVRERSRKLRRVARQVSNAKIDAVGQELDRVRRRRASLVGKLNELAAHQDRAADNPDWDEDPAHVASALDATLDAALESFQAGQVQQGIDQVVASLVIVDEILDMLNAPDADEPDEGAGSASSEPPDGVEPATSMEYAEGVKHTHAKEGGGKYTHTHTDAVEGHSHVGLLPLPVTATSLRAVDNSAWDGGAAMSSCANAMDPAAAYAKVCAGRKAGDPKLQSSWALPHHKSANMGPNATGVRNSLARIDQTQGLTNKAAALAHLQAHMKEINPNYTPANAERAHAHTVEEARQDGLLSSGYRLMPLGVREAAQAGDGNTLFGHFAVFNEWTEINSFFEGHFMERIAPGAFKQTFAEDRDQMRVLFQHGRDPMLGSKPIASITTLEEQDQGAYYEASLLRGIPDLVLDGIDKKQYGASFRFEVTSESWVDKPKRSDYNPQALPERTMTGLRVAEFGPVTFPQYTSATAGLRSLTDEFVSAGRPGAGSAGGSRASRPDDEQRAEQEARDRQLKIMGVIK